MSRPITLFTGQWADLPLEEVARLASEWGYDGLEIACWGDHLDVERAAVDDSYLEERKALLDKHGLKVQHILAAIEESAAAKSSLIQLSTHATNTATATTIEGA